MRIISMALILAGCQEYSVVKPVDPDLVEPGDSDAGLSTDSDTDTPIDTDVDGTVDEPTPDPDRIPDIEVDPPELLFGSLPVDCTTAAQVVTITNVGDGPLDISAITLEGPQAPAFNLWGAGAGRVRAGQSVEVQVDFTPTGPRSYPNASLRVVSNDPDEGTVNVFMDGSGIGEDVVVDEWVQRVTYDVVDVLFIIDTSESMSDNIAALGNAMDAFIQQFVSLGLDYQIGVTTTDMDSSGAQGELTGPIITNFTSNPVAEFNQLIDQGAAGSFTERAFAATQAALSAPLNTRPPNVGLVRPDAALSVVVLSDEDDQDANPGNGAVGVPRVTDDFTTWLMSLKADPDKVNFNGMVGPRAGGGLLQSACPGGLLARQASRAPQYHRAIGNTGGVFSSICALDVVPFLQHLGATIAGLDDHFPLSSTPSSWDCADMVVTVNGTDLACGQWAYDAATNEVEIFQGFIAGEGETTSIRYPVSGGCP